MDELKLVGALAVAVLVDDLLGKDGLLSVSKGVTVTLLLRCSPLLVSATAFFLRSRWRRTRSAPSVFALELTLVRVADMENLASHSIIPRSSIWAK